MTKLIITENISFIKMSCTVNYALHIVFASSSFMITFLFPIIKEKDVHRYTILKH